MDLCDCSSLSTLRQLRLNSTHHRLHRVAESRGIGIADQRDRWLYALPQAMRETKQGLTCVVFDELGMNEM